MGLSSNSAVVSGGKPVHRYGTVWALLDALVRAASVIMLAFAGGVFNRMRGSGGGALDLADWTSYWPEHALDRAVMAFPTGALLSVLTRESLASFIVTLLTWASLIVGWGTYFGMGVSNGGFVSRIGVFDWWFGREQLEWTLGERWVRDAAAMSLRGLVWTAPSGYLLHHRGLGWHYALAGAMMGPIYSIGQGAHFAGPSKKNGSENSGGGGGGGGGGGNDGSSNGDFMFGAGVPWSESVWGTWLWAVLILACLSRPHMATGRRLVRGVGYVHWFETGMCVFTAYLFASCIYYATVVQCDESNWVQTFIGLLVSTVALGAQQAYNYHGWRRGRAAVTAAAIEGGSWPGTSRLSVSAWSPGKAKAASTPAVGGVSRPRRPLRLPLDAGRPDTPGKAATAATATATAAATATAVTSTSITAYDLGAPLGVLSPNIEAVPKSFGLSSAVTGETEPPPPLSISAYAGDQSALHFANDTMRPGLVGGMGMSMVCKGDDIGMSGL